MYNIWIKLVFLSFLTFGSRVSAQDIGATKNWGSIQVTLKEANISGNKARVSLLFQNTAQKPEPVSLLMMEILSTEGDVGKADWAESECGGTIPPMGPLKCRLVYNFTTSPMGLNIQVGAGFLSEPVFFKIGK